MLRKNAYLILSMGLMTASQMSHAHTEAIINLHIKHTVGGKDSFKRQDHIGLHSTLNERDWLGDEDKLHYMMNDLDVHFGRDNGLGVFNFKQADEDPNNPGFADPNHIIERGQQYKQNVWNGSASFAQQYDGRGDIIVGGQPYPHFFGNTDPYDGGPSWTASPEAVGDYFGQFMNAFFRDDSEQISAGHKRPMYFEILNEPLYQLTDAPEHGNDAILPIDIFTYHNQVAEAFRVHNQDVKIGGYVAAFPVFEERDFARWDERMKLFMDTSGDLMDYWSLHFYDLEDDNRYKGSRLEATLDMVDHYSYLKFGEVKEHVISEYGGRNRPMEKQPWSPLRDWWFLKTASPMLVQFLDRPDTVVKSLPFVPVKAEWGRASETVPYNWRLLRQAKEGAGETGDHWVFTEMVKFYQLWSEVNGTRVESFSTNNDVLVESFVDNNKAYVIASNLTESTETLMLHTNGDQNRQLVQVNIKQLYLKDSVPFLSEQTVTSDFDRVELSPEATTIIEYVYDSEISQTLQAQEQKYFAVDFLQPIYANESINTTIDGVEVPTFADVKLRLVVGRDHNTSLTPIVTFNGHLLNHQLETMGDEQTGRDRFFGLLEFNVPFDVLNNSNTIEVIFPDNGGHLASVNMKVLSISDSARPSSGDVEGVLLSSNTDTLAIGQQTNITASVYPYYATNKKVVFSSSDDNIASVDNNGLITGHSAGQVVITATSEQGEFNDSVTINVEAPTNISMQFDDRNTYINTVYTSGETLDVTVNFDAGTGNSVAADFGGIEYFFRHMASNWSVIKDIKIRDASVIGKQRGTSSVAIPLNDVTPSADLENGEFYFLFIRFKNTAGQVKNVNAFPIQVAENIVVIEPSLTFDDASKYTNTTYETNGTLDVQVNFEAGTGQTVSDSLGGIKFFLRELTPNFNVVNDVIVYDSSAIGNQSGIASASIPLAGLTPSAQLPDGNFYYLFATFQSTSGTKQNIDGVFPINIEQSATLEVADINQLKSAIHIVGQKMNVAVDFNMGSGNTVTDGVGGVRYILRELTPTFSVVKDIIVEDSSVIGLNSGTSNIAIPLDGITPASELPTGHFYYLFVVIESSDNSRLTTAVFPLQIEAQPGDFDRDGDVDQRDFVELTKAIAKKQIISAAFDFDNNGVVDQKDAVKMRSLCSNKNCAVE